MSKTKSDTFDYDTIRKHRPNLSDSSLRTYRSILTNLYKKMNPDQPYDKTFFNNNSRDVIHFLKDVKPSLRKTTLSSLTVYTLGNKEVSDIYRNLMMNDGKIYQEELQGQKRNEKQSENWITQQEIQKIYNLLEKHVKPIFNSYTENDDIPVRDLEKIQDYVIASIYTLIPPRRLLDYSEFKLSDYTENEDNYLKAGTFYFNKFKTAKFKRDSFKIPVKLKNIVVKWSKISGSKWLIFQSRNKNKHISPSYLNNSLHRIFGDGISVNNLRHSFLTEFYKNVMPLEEIRKVNEKMGHSLETSLEYVKNE